MKSLTWMVISLFLVCLIASGLLSKVYTITKVQIEKQMSESILLRLSDVLPGAKKFEVVVPDTLWVGFDEQNQKVGIVFKIGPRGYAGPIPILVGYGVDSMVKKIYIASASEGLKETPGLGLKVKEPKFKNQFSNKTYAELKLVKDGGSIQAITAATISSRAVVKGAREGIERFRHFILIDTVESIQFDTSLNENMLTRLSNLLPGAKNFQDVIKDTVWIGYDDKNQVNGIIFKVAPEGYAGLIPILVGYGTDQTIRKIYISSPDEGLKETSGFGLQIREDEFRNQFSGKKISNLKFTDNGGSIKAISGATISSNAVLTGIRQGIEKYKQFLNTDNLK
ncbi:FMN-binding protein [Dolichospermum sp. ST_sed9]|nr:FMN-binding protein [Dolichospermum sp. ST_sed9]